MLGSWYLATTGTFIIGRVIPAPNLIDKDKSSSSFFEIIIGARIRKNVYGSKEILNAKELWHQYLIRVILMIMLFGFNLSQYGYRLNLGQQAIMMVLLVFFVYCSLSIKIIIDSIHRKEYARLNGVHEVWTSLSINRSLLFIPIVIALAGILIPYSEQ